MFVRQHLSNLFALFSHGEGLLDERVFEVFIGGAQYFVFDVWESLFKTLADDPDSEYLIIDIVWAHQHVAGANGGLKIRPLDARAAA